MGSDRVQVAGSANHQTANLSKTNQSYAKHRRDHSKRADRRAQYPIRLYIDAGEVPKKIQRKKGSLIAFHCADGTTNR